MIALLAATDYYWEILRGSDCISLNHGPTESPQHPHYRVDRQVWDYVLLPVCSILLGQLQIWQNWHSMWETWWDHQSLQNIGLTVNPVDGMFPSVAIISVHHNFSTKQTRPTLFVADQQPTKSG